MPDVLEPQAKTRVRLEPRRGQKRESTQLLPNLEEEVTSTIQGGSSSSAYIFVESSEATSVSVEDMVQTYVPEIEPAGVHREYSHHNTISSHVCCARVL